MEKNINTQFLDEELNKLKAIGVKELSKTTKLSSSKIEDVLEKRFDKIDRVRAKGFIAILEREYHVDLHDWIVQWQNTQKESIKSVSQVISKQDEEERILRLVENVAKVEEKQKEKEQQKNEQKNRDHQVLNLALKGESPAKSDMESYNWLYVILVAILLALMGYFAYKAFIQDHGEREKPQSLAQTSDDSHLSKDDSYDGIFFDPTKPQEDIVIVEESQTEPDLTQTQEVISQDMPQTSPVDSIQEAQSHPEQNFFFNSQATTQTAQFEQNVQDSQAMQNTTVKDNILHITSDFDLWLGVINLETGSKEDFSYKKEYDVKLSHKMLFVMGHSNFKLTLNGENISHGTKYPVRMYYDGTTLQEVGYTTFKQLNGGKEW
ncbi:MAG: hypothetical protein J1E28_03845 [Helicobacter sp.]|uniref:hypothetical protein n=1 Tax=Helicobacter sp. TaxID=218 RepID=UPI0025BBC7A4|nr:hypothetical protein [Helicobacter sp.]MCH5313516.1 hypothetical protein [Helicobacter sp.]